MGFLGIGDNMAMSIRMRLWSELRSGTTFHWTSGLMSWEQKVMSGAVALSPTLCGRRVGE